MLEETEEPEESHLRTFQLITYEVNIGFYIDLQTYNMSIYLIKTRYLFAFLLFSDQKR
jgi:hypothetical protein